jgi:ABC-type protease/lipase transport system fused ATPase/permease subunit
VSLHQHTAIVAQDTELFQGTIRENIVYGLRESEYDDARIVEAAKAANAHDFIMCVCVSVSVAVCVGAESEKKGERERERQMERDRAVDEQRARARASMASVCCSMFSLSVCRFASFR